MKGGDPWRQCTQLQWATMRAALMAALSRASSQQDNSSHARDGVRLSQFCKHVAL